MIQIKRILLVEDDPYDIELTLNALSENNLANDIEVTHNGIEALDYLFRRNKYKSHPPGNPVLVLLDIKMPKMDGIQVLKQLKNDEKLKAIPVVVMTSSREAKDLNECYQLGVNAYVVKPVQLDEFMKAVKEVGVFWVLINEPPSGSVKK